MTQEQKPFEIKDRNWEQVQSMTIREIAACFDDANAEIKRLQGEVHDNQHQLHDNQHQLEAYEVEIIRRGKEIGRLQQQLADAPTWGEWVEREVVIDGKLYEVEFTDGSTRLADNDELRDLLPQNQYNDNKVTQFRRLNYEPKPAREVGKTYDWAGGKYTARELANGSAGISELARDLLAAQARIKELEGK